jgi:choline-sulfatase
LAINAHRKSENLQPTGGVAWQCLQEAMQIPEGMDESTFLDACPALPSNYEIPEKELTAFMTGKPEFMAYAREKWTEREWRHHRWAYARLTERVDAEIGIVLNALKSSGLEENTLVVFTSDHGEQSGAHRVEHKAFLYEESTNVPMIMSWKGTIPAGRVNSQHFVLNGLDIIPTICAAAGIEIPEGMEGKNLLPYAIHPTAEWKRDHIVIENHLSRLVHMGRWKYMVGHESVQGVREMLIDLETDTGEMINRADDQSVQAELLKGRRLLEEKQDSMCYSHNKAYFI